MEDSHSMQEPSGDLSSFPFSRSKSGSSSSTIKNWYGLRLASLSKKVAHSVHIGLHRSKNIADVSKISAYGHLEEMMKKSSIIFSKEGEKQK